MGASAALAALEPQQWDIAFTRVASDQEEYHLCSKFFSIKRHCKLLVDGDYVLATDNYI